MSPSVGRLAVIGALVLAAGASRRFGSDKRCARLASGHSLLGQSVLRVQQGECYAAIAVALRAEDEPLWQQLSIEHDLAAVMPLFLDQHGGIGVGMGDNISASVRRLQDQLPWKPLSGLALILADMPYIQAQTHRALVERASAVFARGEALALRPQVGGMLGHPVLFARALWPILAECAGEQGARSVLQHVPWLPLPLEDRGVLYDIDTPQDLAAEPLE